MFMSNAEYAALDVRIIIQGEAGRGWFVLDELPANLDAYEEDDLIFIEGVSGVIPPVPPLPNIPIPALPSQDGTLIYTGGTQTPDWLDFDVTQLTIAGTVSAINAGTHTVIFTPRTGFEWFDGTTTPKSVTWSMDRAAGTLSLNPTTVTLNAANLTADIAVTRAGDGIISAHSSNTAIATASVTGNTVTVSHVDQTTGTATITISVAQGTNHLAPANQTASVNAEFIPAHNRNLELNSWEQISAVSNYIENNNLTSSQVATIFGWNVSDTTQTFTVGSVSHTLRLMGVNHDNLNQTGTQKAGLSFELIPCWGATTGDRIGMEATNTNVNGWDRSRMRTTTLPGYLNQLPQALRDVIKPIWKRTGAGNMSSSLVDTQDSLWLLSHMEVFGSSANSAPGEGTRYAYYIANDTASPGRQKQQPSGTNAFWWLRSPVIGNTDDFLLVGSSGNLGNSGASNALAVSFGLCI
jgi:hypothetical protein